MNRLVAVLLWLMLGISSFAAKEEFKPYLLLGEEAGKIEAVAQKTEALLKEAKFEILGSYVPAGDAKLKVIVITDPEIRQSVDQVGDLSSFSLAFRIGFSQAAEDKVEVACMNPEYWGNAYFQKKFSKVKKSYEAFEAKLRKALETLKKPEDEEFGSSKGKDAKKLQNYQYMMFMPYFKDVVVLASGKDFDRDAVLANIEKNLAAGHLKAKKVYRVESEKAGAVVFGVALMDADRGEPHFLPIIDIDGRKHSPFLPYEILVLKDKAVMMHGRFRIALSFPSLTMTTFTKIMSTPGDIEDQMRGVVQDGLVIKKEEEKKK